MRYMKVLILASGIVISSTGAPCAREVEIGASMVSVLVGLGGDNQDLSAIGTPAGGFGIIQPTLFGSIFVKPRISVEPQLGLLWLSDSGQSIHFYHTAVQVNYFLKARDVRSTYLFGSVGLIDFSQSGDDPQSLSIGAGYRIPLGGRLVFRADGRLTHLTNDGGNSLNLSLAIGGMFGR